MFSTWVGARAAGVDVYPTVQEEPPEREARKSPPATSCPAYQARFGCSASAGRLVLQPLPALALPLQSGAASNCVSAPSTRGQAQPRQGGLRLRRPLLTRPRRMPLLQSLLSCLGSLACCPAREWRAELQPRVLQMLKVAAVLKGMARALQLSKVCQSSASCSKKSTCLTVLKDSVCSPTTASLCAAARLHHGAASLSPGGGKFRLLSRCLCDLLRCIALCRPESLTHHVAALFKQQAQLKEPQLFTALQAVCAAVSNKCGPTNHPKVCKCSPWMPSVPPVWGLGVQAHCVGVPCNPELILQCIHCLSRSATECHQAVKLQAVLFSSARKFPKHSHKQKLRTSEAARAVILQLPAAVLQVHAPDAARRSQSLPLVGLGASCRLLNDQQVGGRLFYDRTPRARPGFVYTNWLWGLLPSAAQHSLQAAHLPACVLQVGGFRSCTGDGKNDEMP